MAIFDFALPEHDRKLLPDGRVSGHMLWVLAIMVFLTLLSCAAGIIIARSAFSGSDELTRKATIQIMESDPLLRETAQRQVVGLMLNQRGVISVKAVPDTEVRNLLAPWLGSNLENSDIPLPMLVDAEFDQPVGEATIKFIRERLRPVKPDIRVDSHASWMAPFFQLMQSLLWLSTVIVLLLLAATAATVALAVRSALNTHRPTIEIMHMIGATDFQIARLFQRRVALDSLQGGLLGFGIAILVIWLISGQFGKLEAALFADAYMPWYGTFLLALVPLLVMVLGMLVARWTVLTTLKKML
jgi:cell division transport system permease protein